MNFVGNSQELSWVRTARQWTSAADKVKDDRRRSAQAAKHQKQHPENEPGRPATRLLGGLGDAEGVDKSAGKGF